MQIIRVVPSGYCLGVIRAIQIARKTVEQYPNTQVSMLGMIVHNQYVVDACSRAGIHFVEDPSLSRFDLLDQINEGVVIFTAHGVSDQVKQKAEKKGLIIVDATCPDVIKTHDIVKKHVSQGGDVLYIGKKHHPESEGTVSLSDHVHLITCAEEVESLKGLQNVLITNQTTLSILDIEEILQTCLTYYPDAIISQEICNATRIRQEAVLHLSDTDLLIVVGDKRSNNSNQLKQLGIKAGIKDSLLIDCASDLKEEMIINKEKIAVTAGSSTPNELTEQVIEVLKEYQKTGIWKDPMQITCSLL